MKNIVEVVEDSLKELKGPWKLGREFGTSQWSSQLPKGSTIIVAEGTVWALGEDVLAVPEGNEKVGEFVVNAVNTYIPALLERIKELEEEKKI